jgi:hypothetical protein
VTSGKILIRVKTDQIPSEPGRFCMSYGFDNSALKRSILQAGIINNPYICRNDQGVIEVVTGYRRILALKELDIKNIECFDLTDSGMSSFDMLKLAINDNLFTREFNLVEKSTILHRLISLAKDDNSINEVISLLKINKKEYELILKIEGLEESIKNFISSGSLNVKTLEHLVYLDIDNQIICTNWIDNLKLNYNQQIQFIDYIIDISRIEKISIPKLLNEEFFITLLSDKKKNIPQKAKELIDNLRQRRNPDYSKYKLIFEKKIRKLQLPKNIRIKHPSYFESEFYQMEIEFKDGNELINSLNKLIDRDELANIGDF